MKIISAQQRIQILASEIEVFKQSDNIDVNDLKIVTLDSHKSQIERMTAIPIETISENDIQEGKLLEQFNLDEEKLSLYNDLIKKGGYVLLAKDDIADSEVIKRHKNNDGQNEMFAPGFGVDIEPEHNYKNSKEDNVDPENPTP